MQTQPIFKSTKLGTSMSVLKFQYSSFFKVLEWILCTIPGPEVMDIHWNSGNNFSLCRWPRADTVCLRRLWSLHPWRSSKSMWTYSWTTGCAWVGGLHQIISRGSFPPQPFCVSMLCTLRQFLCYSVTAKLGLSSQILVCTARTKGASAFAHSVRWQEESIVGS